MTKIKNLITQLKDEDYKGFESLFKEKGAEKTALLLSFLRKGDITDKEIIQELEVGKSAFYTLKSRLYSKLQQYLINNSASPKLDLIRQIENIPNMIYNMNKGEAIAILTKLEKELLDYDLPDKLTLVYSALKKMHANSPKFYDYSQLYNQHIAYNAAIEKVEDLTTDFNRKLGLYLLSRDSEIIEHLKVIKDGVSNTCRLYESHRLSVYENIVNISFELFLPAEEITENDDPIETLLENIDKIMSEYEGDAHYQYMNLVYYFLNFEYYHHFKIHSKETEFFEFLNGQLPSFLLYNFISIPSHFLLSKINRYVRLGEEENLYNENKDLIDRYEPDKSDIVNYINYTIYLSVSCFYANEYEQGVEHLYNLRNEVSLKDYPHASIEVKLLLSILYTLTREYDLAWDMLRSVDRKAKSLEGRDYNSTFILIKMLNESMKIKSKNIEEKLHEQMANYNFSNQGPYKILPYFKIDDAFCSKLISSVKV